MESTTTNWSKPTRYIACVGLALFGIFILYLGRQVIPMLVVAGLIALIVRPIILWLQNQIRLPRLLAVGLVYLALIIMVPLIIFLTMPAILNAGQSLRNLDYATLIQNAITWLRSTVQAFKALPVPVEGLNQYIDRNADTIIAALQQPTISGPERISVYSFWQSLSNVLTITVRAAAEVVGNLFSRIAVLLFTLLASVYISLSGHTYRTAFLGVVPERFRSEIGILLARIERTWNAFFHVELVLMSFIGGICWLGLALLGVPGAFYLGLMAGLLEIIPSIGSVIATILAVFVALLYGSAYLPINNITLALVVILFYWLVQLLENNLIVPKVLGEAVNLPPLVMLTGVWVGAEAGGLIGVLLATPLIATVLEIMRYVYRKALCENPFPPEEHAPTTRGLLIRKKRDWVEKLPQYWNRTASKPTQSKDEQTG
jgi:predicted PurR-regulated permease PerM